MQNPWLNLAEYELRLALGIIFCSLQFACGPYSFSSSGATHIKSIAIPIFQDVTSEFGIKEKLTDQVTQDFISDNSLKVLDRRNADSILEGTILRVENRAGAFTTDETVQEIKVFLTVQVRYEDLKNRKIIWEEAISQWGDFNPDASEGATTREEAIEEAIRRVSNEILNRSVSGW